mmetsp:Transcript_13522/g.38429  ORF Transcript_13522/g.38429 Transcript_13522/m.38429 type:complete len:305 (+) Transcript_13522:42-956(+)
MKVFVFVGVVVGVVVLAGGAHGLPVLNMTGFSWAENAAFDNVGNLFVTDSVQGKVYRIFLNEEGSDYVRALHLTFKKCNGIVFVPGDDLMYALAVTPDGPTLVSFSSQVPEQYESVAALPTLGNGLVYDEPSDSFYATTEGNFIPGAGYIFRILKTGKAYAVVTGLNAPDGAQLLNGQLYVSLVLGAKMFMYDLVDPDHPRLRCDYNAPDNVVSIDDFCFSRDGTSVIAADFRGDQVVQFPEACTVPAATGPASVVLAPVTSPTSVYLAPSDSTTFNTTVSFITEGGSVVPIVKNRRVLQSPPL